MDEAEEESSLLTPEGTGGEDEVDLISTGKSELGPGDEKREDEDVDVDVDEDEDEDEMERMMLEELEREMSAGGDG